MTDNNGTALLMGGNLGYHSAPWANCGRYRLYERRRWGAATSRMSRCHEASA
jgi:hypothetical protein